MTWKCFIGWTGVVAAMFAFPQCCDAQGSEPKLYEEIAAYVEKREAEFDLIPIERKEQLEHLSDYLRECQDSGDPARLIFVCTHNSRRSHISQLWASVAAIHYGMKHVETFSGGTECTAFNPRAVAAMERAGLKVEVEENGKNPNYVVSFARNAPPQICFSKVYSDPINPTASFCAVMTCSSADKSCPNIKGAAKRVAIPYDDPKVADDTPEETSKYDERSAQICREILFAFSRTHQR
jgi:arsenate reductase (thioredoxin)